MYNVWCTSVVTRTHSVIGLKSSSNVLENGSLRSRAVLHVYTCIVFCKSPRISDVVHMHTYTVHCQHDGTSLSWEEYPVYVQTKQSHTIQPSLNTTLHYTSPLTISKCAPHTHTHTHTHTQTPHLRYALLPT